MGDLSAIRLPGFDQDPYPTYEAWRESAPVHWTQEFLDGAWVVTRHADVDALLRDGRFSAQRVGGWLQSDQPDEPDPARRRRFRQLFARALLFLDDPDHTRIRQVLRSAFAPAAMRDLAAYAEQAARELVDAADPDAGFDFMTQVARPLPARVIAHWMGLGHVDQREFMEWSEAIAVFIGALRPTAQQALQAEEGLVAMAAELDRVLEQRRGSPGDDLVSALLRAQEDGELKAGAELVAQCAMLLFAGYETSRNLLGNGLHALLSHPAQWQRLQDDPSLLPGAVRELLRFDSPVQYTARRVATDLTLHDRSLRRGDAVIAVLAAANRDPRVFDRPDELDVGRRGAASLSFGAGAHACIGAALTQLEAHAAYRALMQRCAGIELVEPAGQWNGNPVYRGLVALPLRRSA